MQMNANVEKQIIKPKRGQVVIERPSDAKQHTTKSGIIIMTDTENNTDYFRVVSVADDITEVTPGDKVVTQKYGAKVKFTHDGRELFIVNSKDLICKLDE